MRARRCPLGVPVDPQNQGLFLANSMPIRDMDSYADFKGHAVFVNGNRGASGIDGLIASAAGFSQRTGKTGDAYDR